MLLSRLLRQLLIAASCILLDKFKPGFLFPRVIFLHGKKENQAPVPAPPEDYAILLETLWWASELPAVFEARLSMENLVNSLLLGWIICH